MKFSWKKYAIGTVLMLCQAIALPGCGGGGSEATTLSVLSGRVALNGVGLFDVTVAVTGSGSASLTTDQGGGYSFTGIVHGGYTFTPSKPGYSFNPVSQAVTVTNGSVTVPEFTANATPVTYAISGKVTVNGAGLPSATVTVFDTISGVPRGSVFTDNDGNYTFSGVPNGNYTITPAHLGHAFTPPSVSPIVVNNASITGQDFTATQTGSIIIDFG